MDTGLGAKAYAIIEQGKIGLILSARPTDRRQLIEEAAGVTKYKSRRRAAELKLEAAQQNLTRIDDIVFEVEKQRGTLKRQAAKARRYKRLRDELRRWEKVLFARRYRLLGEAIEAARARLDRRARARDVGGRARLAEVETTLERLRLELAEADAATTAAREAAHASELEIGRLQQQIAFDQQQVEQLGAAAAEIDAEVRALEARREPARLELEARREAARTRATAERDGGRGTLRGRRGRRTPTSSATSKGSRATSRRRAARCSRRSTPRPRCATRSSTRPPRGRGFGEPLAKLEVEERRPAGRSDRAPSRIDAPPRTRMARAHEALETLRIDRGEPRVGAGRRARRARGARRGASRTRDTSLAGVTARLKSLEELDAARAEYGDGARLMLAEAPAARSASMGAVADYLEVDSRLRARGRSLPRRAAPARRRRRPTSRRLPASGWPRRTTPAASASSSPMRRRRCRSRDAAAITRRCRASAPCSTSCASSGPAADAIRDRARRRLDRRRLRAPALAAACRVERPDRDADGEVFRGLVRVEGGARAEARGILTTKREIKELRERADEQRAGGRAAARRRRVAGSSRSPTESAILVAAGRAASAGESRSSASSCRSANARNATRAGLAQAGADRQRAPDGGRGAPRAGCPPGRGAGVDRAHRDRAARRRRRS